MRGGAGSFLWALSLSTLRASWKTLFSFFQSPPKKALETLRGQLGAVTQRQVPWVPRSRHTAHADSSRHNHHSRLGTKAES